MPTPAKASPAWTKEHEDALSGLVGLQIPKKEAKQFLESLQSAHPGELMRQALAARTRSQQPPQLVPGAPQGAVPIHPPQRQTAPAPPPPAQLPAAPIQKKPDMFNRIANALTGWAQPSWVGGGPLPPKAPITAPSAATPAAAQTQPGPQGPPPVKPRIRVPLVSRQVPPAPIGKAPEEPQPDAPAAKEKAAPLPLIRTAEEYEQLAPGTDFIWRSDGHIYSKPEAKYAKPE